MNRQNKNQIALETAVIAVVMALLSVLGLGYAPFFYIATLLLPIPLAFLIVRRNLFYGLAALVITTLLLLFAAGSVQTVLLMVLQFGPVGIFIGLLLKNKVAMDKSMAVLFFWALMVGGLNALAIFVVGGVGTSSVAAEFYAVMENAADLYVQKNVLDMAGKEQFLDAAQKGARLVQTLIPGGMAAWAIVMTMLTYFITRLFLRLWGYLPAGYFRFDHWQLPWYSIWLVIIGLGSVIAGEQFNWSLLGAVGTNILFLAAFVFLILGLAVLVFYLGKWKMHRFFKIVIVAAMVLYFPFAMMLLLSVGLADTVANLRRLPRDDDDIPT